MDVLHVDITKNIGQVSRDGAKAEIDRLANQNDGIWEVNDSPKMVEYDGFDWSEAELCEGNVWVVKKDCYIIRQS